MRLTKTSALATSLLLHLPMADAQPQTPSDPASQAPEAVAESPEDPEDTAATSAVTLAGYVESFYSWNFERPGNQITNLRGFDNRHDSVTLSNVVLDATGTVRSLSGRIALQVGHTPNSYYLAEPRSDAAGGAGESDRFTWRLLQQALIDWTAPVGRGLLLEVGLCVSPIGPESIAAKDDWNFSRSNLFFGLPFYHTGGKLVYPFTNELKVVAAVYNGWNSVVDNNGYKSYSAQLQYTRAPLSLGALYFGGVERPRGAPEGQPWRHLFDVWAQLDATDRLQFLAQADAGFEANDFGTSSWYAGALYARYRVLPWMWLAARGDWFSETAASNEDGTAATLFWPATDSAGEARIASATFTVDVRPLDHLSFRLEVRHDDSNVDVFFDHHVDPEDPELTRSTQDTLTAAGIAWF